MWASDWHSIVSWLALGKERRSDIYISTALEINPCRASRHENRKLYYCDNELTRAALLLHCHKPQRQFMSAEWPRHLPFYTDSHGSPADHDCIDCEHEMRRPSENMLCDSREHRHLWTDKSSYLTKLALPSVDCAVEASPLWHFKKSPTTTAQETACKIYGL